MRSNAFADHLIENGFEKFMLLKRVQSFPQLCSTVLSNPLILKFGGYTGTGKTEILHSLKRKGNK
jgi:tRNA 2-selenouridine synthase